VRRLGEEHQGLDIDGEEVVELLLGGVVDELGQVDIPPSAWA